MIRVTRLNGSEFIINAELIKFVEATPDTIVTLRDGEKLVVREAPDLIIERSIQYARATRFLPEQ